VDPLRRTRRYRCSLTRNSLHCTRRRPLASEGPYIPDAPLEENSQVRRNMADSSKRSVKPSAQPTLVRTQHLPYQREQPPTSSYAVGGCPCRSQAYAARCRRKRPPHAATRGIYVGWILPGLAAETIRIKAAPAAPLARRQRRALPCRGPPGARRATAARARSSMLVRHAGPCAAHSRLVQLSIVQSAATASRAALRAVARDRLAPLWTQRPLPRI